MRDPFDYPVAREQEFRRLLVRIGEAVFGKGARFALQDVPAAVETALADRQYQPSAEGESLGVATD